ncbi:hypothetical protein [Longimicrobium sp.]|uniref:hypothetical protein n=1 Tax=Longimicrobium sp. TaxID=2029185 RepID=UPI002E37ACEC|nr:hypothetical protein [Longimicrobium sp.]HEX6038099.1 hypothetical protein [Longimicrobium sp.]
MPRRRAVPAFAALVLALSPVAAAAQQTAAQTPPPPMVDQVRGLGLDSLAGPLPVHYSAGFRDRAGEVQGILREGVRFFADSLGLAEMPVRVALLTEADWQRVSRVPYGVPFVQGGVVVMPAAGDGPIAADFLAAEPGASAAARELVARTGLSFADNARRMTDLIGYHELGHGYTTAYGIQTHARWFNEFMATYMAYAFLDRMRPPLARGWEAMLRARLDGARPAHTSLAAFDSLYIRVGPENYNWYQAAFALQAAEVFRAEGLAFLPRLREAFPVQPPGTPRLGGDEVVARLETLHPGFRAWAEGLAASAP